MTVAGNLDVQVLADFHVRNFMDRAEFALLCIAAGYCDGPTATTAWDKAWVESIEEIVDHNPEPTED